MLSPTHYEKLKSFSDRLEEMVKLRDFSELQSSFQQLELDFQRQIMPLSFDVNSQWQSYLTEMHKQIRLLQTELMFLRSVRQPDKVLVRLAKVHQCLAKLDDYCQSLLDIALLI
jgi:hypothetical protein